ncbi:hypothetical protein WA026_009763 [Henosepilachna vigintioctopunctata]|uniref:Uncharacterized protein n=1 Tax=Henosepilachna vigintioctopunctata TaxID=420089 RepID=A0AAW1TKX9_9CUCU
MNIWPVEEEIHMAISNKEDFRNLSNKNENYNKTTIYKWLGSHFDPVQSIYDCVTKLVHFNMENKKFIVVNIDGLYNESPRDYAEIYRYNLQTSQYDIQQRIPLENCKDIKAFSMKKKNGRDFYLAVANYASGENDTELPSIIYKYVDGYFIPFQDLKIETILEFVPVETADTFLLISRSEFQPLKTFQYDGWSFRETLHNINWDLSKNGITSLQLIDIENKPTLVVRFSGEENALEFYNLTFVHENQLSKFHDDILVFCENNLNLMKGNGEQESRNIREIIRDDSVNSGDLIHEDDGIPNSTETIRNKIHRASLILDELEDLIQFSLQKDGQHILQDIEADEIILKNINIRSLTTETINDNNINEILDNVIDINQDGRWTDDVILEHAQIDTQIHPQLINGIDANDVIRQNEDLEINQLNIKGQAIFSDSIITKTVNDIVFDIDNILMNNVDQNFEALNVDKLRATNINPDKINSRNIKDLEVDTKYEYKNDRIPYLKTKKIVIGGFINNVDMRTLDKYSLKINGDQTISETFWFEDLQANNMDVNELSGMKLVENLIRTDSGQYDLKVDAEFTDHLTVNKLVVDEYLDVIPVVEGRLQVLLKDVDELQHITVKKTVDEVELLNPFSIQGNINSRELEKINPIITIENSLIFSGDFEITGNTSIENMLKVDDITAPGSNYSVKKVLSHGILLRDTEIDFHLNFEQQLNVDEIVIDKVNGIDPEKWLLTGTNRTQVVSGAKVFVNDVTITGNTNFSKVNNIELSDLQNSILRNNGDQIISGKHTLMNMVADRVTANNITLGNKPMKDIVTILNEQFISGTTVVEGDIAANISKSSHIKIDGTVNGFDFTKIIEDTVMKNSEKPISSHKTFRNFTTKDLILPNLKTIDRKKIIKNGNVRMKNPRIKNIQFMKSCNDVEMNRFGEDVFGDGQVEIVSELKNISKLVVHGNVYIESGFLNDIYIQDFETDTVKIDEENEFKNAVFDVVFSEAPIILHGQMEYVDFENLVLSNTDQQQIVLDSKTFQSSVTVFGNVSLDGFINDIDPNNVCSFMDSDVKHKNLEIRGNAIFTKGPNVHKVFNVTLDYIVNNAWFKNKAVTLPQFANFSNITFFNNVTAKGLVDGVSLVDLRDYYFSKTKNQKITGGIYFANHVNFLGNLVSPKLAMNGAINGIKISELPRTVLLQDEDQVFEEMVYLEELFIDDLQGEYTVNNMNLKTDLLRYDNDNIITGTKYITKLNIENVELKKNISIQSVDILNWMTNAILKKGTFNINKRKIIRQDVYFDEGFNLKGTMNGGMFTNDTIMLKSIPQIINGVKKFEVDPMEVMKFRNMKLKGMLNDMITSELFSDQDENQDLIFKSPMHFYSDIYTKNLCMRKSYNGKNLSEIITKIMELDNMDALAKNYVKFLNMSEMIQENLKEHAFYIQFYKEIQEIKKPEYIINSCCEDSILTYSNINNKSYIMNYYFWDKDKEIFLKSEMALNMGIPPLKMESFFSGRQQFLYMEYLNDEPKSKGLTKGFFWRIDNFNQLTGHGTLISNGIQQITPMEIDQSKCLLLLFKHEKYLNILCDFNSPGDIRFNQSAQIGKYIQSTVTNIDGVPFIILINSQEDNLRSPKGSVEVWTKQNSQFEIHQVIFLPDPPPKNAAAITYRGIHFLSVVYNGGLWQGHVDILRYNKSRGKYELSQKITLRNPVRTEFSVIPSGELLLFVLGIPDETLSVFKYTGISGFKKQITTSSIPYITGFKQFTMGRNHFLIVENGNKLRILQAQFKGILKESL